MFVAAHALRKGAIIDLDGQELLPTLWTVILAHSGDGKTFAFSSLLRLSGISLDFLPDSASAAQFIDNLSQHNRTLYLRDEIGQIMRAMHEQTHMVELKDYWLRAYDHSTIERNTKETQITISKPAFCLLGFSVDETWAACMPPESMLDGLGQRLNFVIPRDRSGRIVPIYRLSGWMPEIQRAWQAIEQMPIHPTYTVSERAMAAYEEAFSQFAKEVNLPMSYFRRAMFSAFKYALVYHLILGKMAPEIDERDIGWAMRVIERHIADAGAVLDGYDASDLERKIRVVENMLAEAREGGKTLTARSIIRRCKLIKTAPEARAILQLVLEVDENAKPEEWAQANGPARRGRPPGKPDLKVVHSAAEGMETQVA